MRMMSIPVLQDHIRYLSHWNAGGDALSNAKVEQGEKKRTWNDLSVPELRNAVKYFRGERNEEMAERLGPSIALLSIIAEHLYLTEPIIPHTVELLAEPEPSRNLALERYTSLARMITVGCQRLRQVLSA